MDSYTLKSVSDLPAPFRSTFSFRYFNSLQSECFPVCFHSDVNMVVSAPTGSGKTVLFELCILRLLSRFISEEKFFHVKGTLKTIYIAPSKALVQEKLRHWNQKFGSWGINCLELTGDNESYSLRNVQEADIILTTPEKFDAVTRHSLKGGGLSFFSDIALLLIDEVHLLNDPRGAALEAIVSRIKILSQNPDMKLSSLANVRFLAVSATIPNIEDLAMKSLRSYTSIKTIAAEWLKVPVQGIKRFGEEMRPVKLTTKVFDILMQNSRGKSALVFCSTRKGAQEAAQRISHVAMTFGHSNPFIKDREQQERLREASLSCSDKQMQSYIIYGVGYHNGGLCLKDRNLIESLFLKGDIQVLCTTNTLAHGINLPAHTVVIKSTQHFNKEKGLYMEYDRSTILQMCGRAGRPPFDDTGVVIIMTRRDTVHLYENLLNGCEMVESQLLSCLTEHLTAEIVQLTVSDITRAIEWMKCSYLYVRMKKNPGNYAVKKAISSDRIEKHLQEICVQKVNELSMHQMIWTDEDGFLLKPLEPGRLMTKYYLKFDSMKLIMQTPVNCTLEDALRIICRAGEIAWIQLRRNEKKPLNDINNDKDGRLRFHILSDNGKRKKRIQTREEKIFVLVNDCLTGDPSVRDLSLTQDMNSICSNGCRIAKCMKEFFIYKKNYKGALNSTLLAKSLYQKLWDDSPYLLKQLPGIGMVTAKALHSMEIQSFEALAEADPRRIEIITGRKYPFGNHIKDSLLSLPPKVDLKVEETECQIRGKSKLMVTLTRMTQPLQSMKRHYADMIVGSEEDNLILFHEKIRVDEFSSPYSATIFLSNPPQGKLNVKADLVFEEYIGIDLHQKVVLVKERSFNLNNQMGKMQQSSFAPPQEVYVIEDDEETTSQAPIKDVNSSIKSKRQSESAPSFNLLDEDLDEGDAEGKFTSTFMIYVSVLFHPFSLITCILPLIIEGELSVKVTEEENKIMTEKNIFDSIREKAKSFPEFPPSNIVQSPSTEALILTRKRTREKQLESYSEVEVLNELGENIPKWSMAKSYVEPSEAEQNAHNTGNHPIQNNHITARNSDASNFMDDAGGLPPDPKDFPFKSFTEETIFDHIRKKAKNFPQLRKQPEYCTDAFDVLQGTKCSDVMGDYILISDTENGEVEKDVYGSRVSQKVKQNLYSGSSYQTFGTKNVTPRISSTGTDQSSIKMPAFDVPVLKNSKEKSDPCSSIESRKKQRHYPSVLQKQCRSLATASKIREVESFLGFETVFSFL
ncbi:DExH-box ATP-dependent RNA helicase DExH17 isoform X4 [Ziziphus jujuba]|uniref:DNA 3'-5' helicase n=2 Tax=Ziziphus jujuba TaxID=326968 RepID=A0ABM3IFY7_ZIZJJ|nr:DExH-box ATP-dependent RNA helicase DExH17 isoform X4 [Ziziphus jujuba]